MADLTNILGGPWEPPAEKRAAPAEEQLLDAIASAGLTPPRDIRLDGRLHRFNSGSKGASGHGDKSGWYIAYGDGIPAGRFGDWRAGVEHAWRADVGRKLTPTEEMAHTRRMAEAKAARDAERAKTQQVAAQTVEAIWVDCTAAHPDHPYLQRKGIGVHGARVTGDGRLVVPLYGLDGAISSLQYISADGTKLYHTGAQTGGKFWQVGASDDPGIIYIAEGFATAATIHEVTHRPCIVAYSASNLVPVTATMREHYGMAQELVIVADHDASGVGQKYAEQAAAKYGARVVMPPTPGDANDYVAAGHDLKVLLDPPADATVISKLKVVFGSDLGEDYEAPDELVEGLITIGSTTVLYGDSNSGKTFWALSLAAAVSRGQEFFGRKVDGGIVIYLASEAPGSIRSRMQALKKYFKCSLENLAMVPVPMNFYSGDADALDIIELVRAIERERGQPVRLIVGDTLARMSAGANENSGEDMGPVMARFEQVAVATGAAMLIIHHNGKDQAKGARGWSGIRAHIDTEIEVVERDGVRSAAVTKQRELPSKGDTIYFKLAVVEMGETKFGAPATTCVAIPDDEADKAQAHAKPSKLDETAKLWERAWWACGAEDRDGLPYVSRSALKEWLANSQNLGARTILNKLEPSRQDGMVHPMVAAQALEAFDHGWRLTDPVRASVLMMQKSGGLEGPK